MIWSRYAHRLGTVVPLVLAGILSSCDRIASQLDDGGDGNVAEFRPDLRTTLYPSFSQPLEGRVGEPLDLLGKTGGPSRGCQFGVEGMLTYTDGRLEGEDCRASVEHDTDLPGIYGVTLRVFDGLEWVTATAPIMIRDAFVDRAGEQAGEVYRGIQPESQAGVPYSYWTNADSTATAIQNDQRYSRLSERTRLTLQRYQERFKGRTFALPDVKEKKIGDVIVATFSPSPTIRGMVLYEVCNASIAYRSMPPVQQLFEGIAIPHEDALLLQGIMRGN